MEVLWSEEPAEPGEHDIVTVIERAHRDSDFEAAYISIGGVLAKLRYLDQIYREQPGEHSVSTLVERGRSDPDFRTLHYTMERVFEEMGASVDHRRADGGEPPSVRFAIDGPQPESTALPIFSNHPA